MSPIGQLDLTKKKYIIFDMDGTLIDSVGIWNTTDFKLISSLSKHQVDLSLIQKERNLFIEQHPETDIYLEYCDYLIQKYQLNLSKEELLKLRWEISGKLLENEIDFKPSAVNLILKLKKLGFTLILASATSQVQMAIYCRKNQKMLKQLDLSQVFDLILTKEDTKKKKPDPEIYHKILAYFKASPEECLVFEDSLHGVLASKSAGIETVNIYDKYSDEERIEIQQIADYEIDSFQEFIDKVIKKDIKRKVKKQ